MTFATLEDARGFIELLLRSRSGDPLIVVSQDGRHGLTLSGTWEDQLGLAAAIIEDNRLVWSRNPALSLLVRDGAVILTLDGDILWEVSTSRDGIAIEGLFFSKQGMVMVTPWGYLGWSEMDALLLVDGAALSAAGALEALEEILPEAHPLRKVH